jgi:hypothetical protein
MGYLLMSSVTVELRRSIETEMLTAYLSALERAGIDPPRLDDIYEKYRLSVLHKFAMTILATVVADNTGRHQSAWRQVDLERLAAFVEDHDPLDAIRNRR